MPLQEKYDRLLDTYLLAVAAGYALNKELGVVDKSNDMWVKVQKNMLPSFLGIGLKMMKAIAPGKAFKQIANQYVYTQQAFIPLSNIEFNFVSDRESTVRIKNCPVLRRFEGLVKKAGLDIDPRSICEMDAKIMPEVAKEFEVALTFKLEEDGCKTTAKLK